MIRLPFWISGGCKNRLLDFSVLVAKKVHWPVQLFKGSRMFFTQKQNQFSCEKYEIGYTDFDSIYWGYLPEKKL